MQVLSNLTEEQKTVIRRDFIQNTLREAFRNGITEGLLMEFANQHAPEGVTEIKAKQRRGVR